ncbi:MAG: class I SAM-dependent methyltransferase [Alphaproteobacteria bacterium]|nr:class I SAM-dependent methyltransferase [Alphaproteobacteria bacterium]
MASPLADRLVALIRAYGPITVADYMSDALFHPNDGYYTSQSPIGARGDFTTAPEVSQIFGELIGLWLVQSWMEIGEPDYFTLVELGPGRGVMMQDILRAAAVRPKFLKAARVQLVETSGRLRHEQQKRLKGAPASIEWKDSFNETADGPILIVANELFDCLPIRQFVMTERGWRERMVNVADDSEQLIFTTAFAPPLDLDDAPAAAAPGEVYEISEAGDALIEDISARLARNKGRALIIDYGHVGEGLGDTLQAIRGHGRWRPLDAPGHADITAHVNFRRLVRRAFDAGAAAYGPVSQSALLDRLGLALRVERLCAGKSQPEIDEIHAGAFRIAAASEMGELFRAIAVSSPELAAPVGFDVP